MCSSLSDQIVTGTEEFQAQFSGNVHVGYADTVTVLFIVVKVFNHFFKDDAVDILEAAGSCLSFTEIAWRFQT